MRKVRKVARIRLLVRNMDLDQGSSSIIFLERICAYFFRVYTRTLDFRSTQDVGYPVIFAFEGTLEVNLIRYFLTYANLNIDKEVCATWTFKSAFAHAQSKKRPTCLTADQIRWHFTFTFLR